MKEINYVRDKVKKLRPIDDVMFQKLAESNEVCQEMLRVILNDKNLIVRNVIPQDSIGNLFGRSVRLDALCTLGDGTQCNIEVQKENRDDHVKRVWFNAASITTRFSEKNLHFSEIPAVKVVFISTFDLFGKGRTMYHIDSVIRETNTIINDGLERVFVNTAYCEEDASDVGELMKCFLQPEVSNEKFPELSKRMNYFKTNKKGVDIMCQIVAELINLEKAEVLVQLIETLAKKVGSLDKACEALEVSRQDYDDAKALVDNSLTLT